MDTAATSAAVLETLRKSYAVKALESKGIREL
jgi:hypothetical protein